LQVDATVSAALAFALHLDWSSPLHVKLNIAKLLFGNDAPRTIHFHVAIAQLPFRLATAFSSPSGKVFPIEQYDSV
jgi:hypothetical protein